MIYWKWRPPEELAQRAEQTGKEDVAPCAPLVSAVFNFDQVEGVARPDDLLAVADQMLDVMPDTESWEQKLAQMLEDMPEVFAHAKNQNLGFTIPYTLNGEEHNYTTRGLDCYVCFGE